MVRAIGAESLIVGVMMRCVLVIPVAKPPALRVVKLMRRGVGIKGAVVKYRPDNRAQNLQGQLFKQPACVVVTFPAFAALRLRGQVLNDGLRHSAE
jgi:hypothetical protein